MLVNSAYEGVEMYQKGRVQSIFADSSRPISMASTIDTEFEEDASDFDDYQGRRSEESVCTLPPVHTSQADRPFSLATPQSRPTRSCELPHQTTSAASTLVYLHHMRRLSQVKLSRVQQGHISSGTRSSLLRKRSCFSNGLQSNHQDGLVPPSSLHHPREHPSKPGRCIRYAAG